MKRWSRNIDTITTLMYITEVDVFLRLYYYKQSYRLLPQLISAPWHFSTRLFIDELLEDKRERFHRKISLTNVCASTFDVNISTSATASFGQMTSREMAAYSARDESERMLISVTITCRCRREEMIDKRKKFATMIFI